MLIDGREYITAAQFTERYGLHNSALRVAARSNLHGIGDGAVKVSRSVKVYPADAVAAWRSDVERGSDAPRGRRGESDIARIARRYDLDRSLVWRAVTSGKVPGVRQAPNGTWEVSDHAAAAWAAEWLGITEPVADDEDAEVAAAA